MRYIGLIPAAGRATRLGVQPLSKEVLPLAPSEPGTKRPRTAIDHLMAAYSACPVEKVFIVIRAGKWDIPQHLGDGSQYGLPIAYLMMGLPYGPPYTADQAYPFAGQQPVLFGFPDILFHPIDAFRRLTARLESEPVDVVLGLFPTDRPHKMDMVQCDDAGRVMQLVIKPEATNLRFAWIIAAWKPSFTHFLHNFALANRDYFAQPDAPEPHVGTVVQAAIDDGMAVAGETFNEGWVIDIGTREDLARARECLR